MVDDRLRQIEFKRTFPYGRSDFLEPSVPSNFIIAYFYDPRQRHCALRHVNQFNRSEQLGFIGRVI